MAVYTESCTVPAPRIWSTALTRACGRRPEGSPTGRTDPWRWGGPQPRSSRPKRSTAVQRLRPALVLLKAHLDDLEPVVEMMKASSSIPRVTTFNW